MSDDKILLYPRHPFSATRTDARPNVPPGWSTLVRRTWHSDEEIARDWVPADVVDRLHAALGAWADGRITGDAEYLEATLLAAWHDYTRGDPPDEAA